MSRAEQEACIRLAKQGDRAARHRLITRNMRLVAHKTRQFRGKVRDMEDLLSVGMIGLIKAVDSYDPARQTPFANYACQCIENEVRMHLRKDQRYRSETSLDVPVSTEAGDRTMLDVLVEADDMASEVTRRLQAAEAKKLVDLLSPLEREVIELRYGLGGGPGLTQREVAMRRNVSRPYISRVERRALDRLSAWLSGTATPQG
jgi:RNA polymerase sporulation-specific sigma factor